MQDLRPARKKRVSITNFTHEDQERCHAYNYNPVEYIRDARCVKVLKKGHSLLYSKMCLQESKPKKVSVHHIFDWKKNMDYNLLHLNTPTRVKTPEGIMTSSYS
jgi:hypothetical protein